MTNRDEGQERVKEIHAAGSHDNDEVKFNDPPYPLTCFYNTYQQYI